MVKLYNQKRFAQKNASLQKQIEESNITKKDNKYNIIIVVPDTRTGEKKNSATAARET